MTQTSDHADKEVSKEAPWPVSIHLNAGRDSLEVTFDNGEKRLWSAERLRVESPSAEVQGHHPSQKKIVMGKADVKIRHVEAVGNYAIRLVFDDGHDSGIYTWSYLYAD